MTRHARNCTAGAVYTYHERKKDASSSGYGSNKCRVGKDSQRDFDCCCLTLQPTQNPVVTPDGYLYDKEAILEYIIHQKRSIARKLKEFERQKEKLKNTETKKTDAQHAAMTTQFIADQKDIMAKKTAADRAPEAAAAAAASSSSLSNMNGDLATKLPSFWLPALTPNCTPTLVKKPDEKVRCPMSGRPIKLKDLTDITWSHIKDGSKKSVIAKDARYVCAVTNDILGNSVPCGILKTSGRVVSTECWEKIIKKDMVDPTNSRKMTDKDFIHMQRGASSFASKDKTLEVKKHGPGIMA